MAIGAGMWSGGGGSAKSGSYSVVKSTGQVLAPGSGAVGGGATTGGCKNSFGQPCPAGTTKNSAGQCCPGAAAAPAAGGLGFSMPSIPTPPAAPAWQPSAVARPNLTPIDPQAAYDPEIANQLARQRSNTADLKAGTGFAEDVAVGAERDQLQAQMREAEQAAAQSGIPFDKARFLMEAQRGQASRRAQSTLNREQQVGESIGAESGVATAQAGERTDRLGIDLKRDMGENELALDRYGRDIQKYGIDAQAATAANNALMGFYSQLTSGAFGMMGSAMSMGGNNFAQSNQYGGY